MFLVQSFREQCQTDEVGDTTEVGVRPFSLNRIAGEMH